MRFNNRKTPLMLAILPLWIAASLLLSACGDATATIASISSSNQPSNGYKVSGTAKIVGSGASFPYQAYLRWIESFSALNPNVTITYAATGSSAGRKAFFTNEVDFGASDTFPPQKEIDDYKKSLIFVPTLVGAVTLAYNLPGVSGLRLSPDTLGSLYTGKITKWNDPKIKADNPNASLPDRPIVMVVREDGSGTTDAFTKYLVDISPEFKALGIAGTLPDWTKAGLKPVKGPQAAGVGDQISKNVGSVGYLDLGDAKRANLSVATIKNKAGNYIAPTPDTISLAAPENEIPANMNVYLSNSPVPGAYPISTTSYVIINKEFTDVVKAEALVTFLWWITHDPIALKSAELVGFAALPKPLLPRVETALKSVTVNGAPILK